jgi:hypothetical protein
LLRADGSCFAYQDKEGRLERILGFLSIMLNAVANAQHHRAVAIQKRCERRLVVMIKKSLQQLPIVLRPIRSCGEKAMDLMQDDLGLSLAHDG